MMDLYNKYVFTWNWTQFCGPAGFHPWITSHNSVGSCFQELTLQIPILTLFAFVSSYYCGLQTSPILRTPRERTILLCRYIVTFFLFILPIVRCSLEINYKSDSLFLVDIVLTAVQTFSWGVHFACILSIRYYECGGLRGPTLLGSLWMLYFAFTILYVRTQYLIFMYTDLHVTYFYFAIIEAILLILYGLTMIPGEDHNAERLRHQNFLQTQNFQTMTASTYSRFREDFDGEFLGTAMENSGVLSRLFFSWVKPLLAKGVNGKLKSTDDFFDLPLSMTSNHLYRKISDALLKTSSIEINAEVTSGYSRMTQPSLVKALYSCFGKPFFLCGILRMISDIAQFCSPLLLYKLVNFIEVGDAEPMMHGYLYAAGLTLTTLIAAFCNEHFVFQANKVSIKMRGALVTTIYKKTLSMSILTLSKISVGEIVNHISQDTNRIVDVCASFHSCWSIPFQLIVTLYLLYTNVGIAAFSGVVFSLLLIPINTLIAKKIALYTTKNMETKDERVRLMSEILRGIRSIKLYVWEQYFMNKINQIRSKEVYYLKWRKYLDALCVFFWATTPVSMSLLTFSVYIMLGNKLTAATVFTSMALLNMLIGPLNAFPWVLNGVTEAWVSLKRVQKLLLEPESDLNAYYSHVNKMKNTNEVIMIKDATFTWHTQHFIMPSISINVPQGKLVGISGPVGCGKSSLIMAICGEIEKQSGVVGISPLDLENGFGLVTQTPWLQHGSIRDNILFGKPYDECLYRTVIEACALTEDLNNLSGGDLVWAGESGVTLSGGQKMRVTLARAVYQNKDVYLFDDIFASVDVHVAAHLYYNCILKFLISRGKTVILATHLKEYLVSAHSVIVMEKGCIIKQGTPSEVLPNYNELAYNFFGDEEEEEHFKTIEKAEPLELSKLPSEDQATFEEEVEKGSLSLNIYLTYMKAVGGLTCVMLFIFLVTMQLSKNGADWWFSYWLDQRNSTEPNNGTSGFSSISELRGPVYMEYPLAYIMSLFPYKVPTDVANFLFIYCTIGTINSFTALGRAFTFASGGIRAATKIHDKLLNSIMKARLVIFDISPSGRILNRFASDVNTVDDSLPFISNILLASLFSLFGAMFLIVSGLPWLTLFLLPLIPIYHRLQNQYRNTSREVKRLSSKSLSPVYSHFNDTLQGLSSIRALRAVPRFKRENEDKLENYQKAVFASAVTQNWLGLRLQLIGVVVVTGVGAIALIQHQSQMANPALVGLAISYALTLTTLLSSVINSMTETEKEMVAVERIWQYINIDKEEDGHLNVKVPYVWPSSGVVQFNNVQLRYRSQLNPALKGISFETCPAEKIGVVGRTGAGKSSLLVSLFRLTELSGGTIYVDKINISNVSLSDLRSRIFVIPQDPFLFSGSIRQNLDPKKKYRESEIWTALQKCHLIPLVKKLGGLNAKLTHEGNNLSNGQKQLMCLVRALLQNAKIIVIDEATANVDQATDRLIQNTIRSCFIQSTVITIAHRIHTVLNCERVLVLSDGYIIEFDSPQTLRANKSSMFYSLVNQSDSSN